jgi:hypothetical protein
MNLIGWSIFNLQDISALSTNLHTWHGVKNLQIKTGV